MADDEYRKGAQRQTIKPGVGDGKPSSRVPHGKKPGWEKAKGKATEVKDHAGK